MREANVVVVLISGGGGGGGETYLVSRHQIPSYAILMLPGSRQILSLLNIYRWSADFQRISDSGGGGEGGGWGGCSGR